MIVPIRACTWLLGHLLRRTAWRRRPDFIIGATGDDYLRRWFIIPRNPVFNLYLHQFLRSDDDRALHDHPWASLSLILAGGYTEVLASGPIWRPPGSIVGRLPRTAHRVLLTGIPPVWSLFITGPRVREWGFHCPTGWRRWQDFVTRTPNGNTTGRGCDP